MRLFKKKNTINYILLIFFIITTLSGCDDESLEAFESRTKYSVVTDTDETWAFYWYICGSDLESDSGFASADLEEMLEVNLPENVTVVIETGGAYEWYRDISSEHNSRFLYDEEGLYLLEENPISNMGDPDTLEDFLRFCNDNYPADRQGVIIWNHGGGSVDGAAYDEIFDFDSLTLPEMSGAFGSSGTASGEKYELIGFDTCYMATIDVVDTFGDYANYLVASEEFEPGGGWDYESLFGAVSSNPSIDGAELGKEICDSYYQSCKYDGTDDMATLSVIDLSWSDKLVEAYNNIGTDALAGAGINSSFNSEFGRAARNAENYGGNNNSEGYTNMVDLGDLVLKAGEDLLPFSGENMLSILDSAVVYQVKGSLRSNATGLSCYYNYNGDYEDYSGFTDLDTSLSFNYYYDYMLTGEISDELVEYMENIAAVSATVTDDVPQPLQIPNKNDLEDFPIIITDEGVATLNLGKEISDTLVGIYASLSYIDNEGETGFLLGFDNDLVADWENGIFEDNFRGVWGSLDGELVYMELSDEADDYQVYAVPILLNGEEYTMLVSYIFITEEFKILGLRLGVDDNGMADKNIRPLIPGDIVEPLHYFIDIDSGDTSQVAVGEIVVTSDTSFYEVDLGDGEFVFMFEMRDVQNNSYLSEAILITIEDGEIYLSE